MHALWQNLWTMPSGYWFKTPIFCSVFSQFWNECGFKQCNDLAGVLSMPSLRSLREFQFYMCIRVVSHHLQQHWESEKINQTHTDRLPTLWITPKLAVAVNFAQFVALPSHSRLFLFVHEEKIIFINYSLPWSEKKTINKSKVRYNIVKMFELQLIAYRRKVSLVVPQCI